MITSLISMALLGDNLDLLTISVEGDGLLRFVKDSKTVYCRNATLVNSPQGLATSDGALLVPRIILPEMTSDVFIDFDGTITAQFGRKYQEVGHLYLANFSKNVELTQSGNYLTTLSKPK